MVKSFTDLEQSKRLAEILPIETADMYYWRGESLRIGSYKAMDKDFDIPCWSLSALLDLLEGKKLYNECGTYRIEGYFVDEKSLYGPQKVSCTSNNSLDACYEMIIKHKEKLLQKA